MTAMTISPELQSHLVELVDALTEEGITASYDPTAVRVRVSVEIPNRRLPQCILFVEPDTYRGKVDHSKHEYSFTSVTSRSDYHCLCRARTFKAAPFAPVAKLVKDIKARYNAIVEDHEENLKQQERSRTREEALKAIREDYPEYQGFVGIRNDAISVTFQGSPKRIREIFGALRTAGLVL